MAAPANPFIPSPTAVNRSAPTGANIPSISLPQNHTLASDPMNQLAQTLSLGMNVPAYDPLGNNGYYSRQTAQTSPLMQRYLMPQNQTSPWLTTAMQRGMPGWTANGDGSFKPGQYNPFQGLNAPPTQGGLPGGAQSPTSGAQNPYGTVPQGSPLDQATYNAYMSNPAVKAYLDALAAQRATQYQPKAVTAPTSNLAASPAVSGTTMNQREYETMQFDGAQPTQQHYDALAQQSQAALRTRSLLGGDPMSKDVLAQGGGAPSGSMESTGYINPAVLDYAKRYPNSLQAQKVAAMLGPNWNA